YKHYLAERTQICSTISKDEVVFGSTRTVVSGVRSAKAQREELGCWPFRRPMKKQASTIWQNEAKKLNLFRADQQPSGEKVKFLIANPALGARYHDRSLLWCAAPSRWSGRWWRRRGWPSRARNRETIP